MEDIIGAGKVVDSEIVKRAYEEAASEPMRQVGKLTTDLIKTFRLFTAPVQLLASYQDRLEGYLNSVRASVPKERQVEAPSEIAGPVLMNLRFMSDENELKNLYLNLLKLAIDKEHQKRAHPGFIKIIEQMSPLDAHFLSVVSKVDFGRYMLKTSERTKQPVADWLRARVVEFKSWSQPDIQSSLDLFKGLSVVDFQSWNQLAGPFMETHFSLELTQYGRNFVAACMPTDPSSTKPFSTDL
jgi:hypothetical protein